MLPETLVTLISTLLKSCCWAEVSNANPSRAAMASLRIKSFLRVSADCSKTVVSYDRTSVAVFTAYLRIPVRSRNLI